jgi:hypothetical protein
MMIVGIVGGLAVLPDRWDRTGFVGWNLGFWRVLRLVAGAGDPCKKEAPNLPPLNQKQISTQR